MIERIQIGKVPIDKVDLPGALAAIGAMIDSRTGGTIFTPNVDHIVLAEADERFRRAYQQVSLSLVDGTPVLWAARLLGRPLPEKVWALISSFLSWNAPPPRDGVCFSSVVSQIGRAHV